MKIITHKDVDQDGNVIAVHFVETGRGMAPQCLSPLDNTTKMDVIDILPLLQAHPALRAQGGHHDASSELLNGKPCTKWDHIADACNGPLADAVHKALGLTASGIAIAAAAPPSATRSGP